MKNVRTQTKRVLSILLAIMILAMSVPIALAISTADIDDDMLQDGFACLPTSPDGLSNGDYWFNLAARNANVNDQTGVGLRWYYNAATGVMREVFIYGDRWEYVVNEHQDNRIITCYDFLMEVGADPLDGFALPAHSKEEMAPGDRFYLDYEDLKDFCESFNVNVPELYINKDGILRKALGYGAYKDCACTENFLGFGQDYYYYLYEVPAPNFVGFSLLPSSPDGLEVGSYWFNCPSWMDVDCYFYLSEDGLTIRHAYTAQYFFDESVENSSYGGLICQVDSLEGFAQLPLSPDGLPSGSKWFDMASFLSENEAPAEVVEIYSTAKVYISEDETVIKLSVGDFSYEINRNESEEAAVNFAMYSKFIKTVQDSHVHDFVDTITTPATCTTTGVRTYTCSCGETVTERIDIDPTNHAALDENGDCPRCGKHVKDVEKPAEPQQEPAGEKTEKLNFFQRIIQWFRNLFARLFKR